MFEVIKELDEILNKDNPSEEELALLLEKVDALPEYLKEQLDSDAVEAIAEIENDLNRLSVFDIIAITFATISVGVSSVIFIQLNKMKKIKG